MTATVKPKAGESPPQIQSGSFEELLQAGPLYVWYNVPSFFSQPQFRNINFPQNIRVHCVDDHCGGVRRHALQQASKSFDIDTHVLAFVEYRCTNCMRTKYLFGVVARLSGDVDSKCRKVYQEPALGRPIPKRLFEVIGEANREFFLQARRAVSRGLGIGAYGYYRRIVENTKFDLVTAVLKVARATSAPPEQINLLEQAQSERQFSKAIELLRDAAAIPAVLLIDGHNPLGLVHDLLSQGIHELSDQECLDRSQEAEVVLFEIADRMQIALTERKSLKTAITNIMNRKQVSPLESRGAQHLSQGSASEPKSAG